VGSLRTALQDLSDYIANNGPFDAVLGFSEGACLAASCKELSTLEQGELATLYSDCF
jgi:hypothetical protein